MSKSQITNERREKNKEKKRRKRFFIYFFGGILAFVFILGLTISPALGSSSNSSKISGGGVNLEGPVETDKIEIYGHLEGKVVAKTIVIGHTAVAKGDILFSETLKTAKGNDIHGSIKKT